LVFFERGASGFPGNLSAGSRQQPKDRKSPDLGRRWKSLDWLEESRVKGIGEELRAVLRIESEVLLEHFTGEISG